MGCHKMKINPFREKKISTLIIFNALLITLMVILFFSYRSNSEEQIREQNLNDVFNINRSAANISSEFFTSQHQKMDDILRYQSKHNLSREEFIQFIDDSNASEDTTFELIGNDYKGIAIVAAKPNETEAVSYEHTDYAAMQEIFRGAKGQYDNISFTPEFSDNRTGVKSFAFYGYVSLLDSTGRSNPYTLMAITETSVFNDMIDLDGGFDHMATALINNDGGYIISNNDFKSDNFFRYLYVYNNLTRDAMNAIQEEVSGKDTGTLNYKNALGEDCVYVYAKIYGTDWYTVSMVPTSSFQIADYDFNSTFIIVILLVILMAVDITWLMELNKKLKETAREARHANRSKTEFLSSMSHDIRTPINVIIGMMELAQNEKNCKETEEYLRDIESSGKFLLGLINDILDLSKVESGKMELRPEPYTYDEFSTYTNAIIKPLCTTKNIDFSLSTNNKEIILVVDKQRFNQIFFNLLSNAVKFTREGGAISLVTNVERLSDKRAHVVTTITDNGVGMSEEFQERMFEAFAQEKNEHIPENAGTGLGLALVKKTVDLMGGTVEARSKEGVGTTFITSLDVHTVDSIGIQEKEIFDEAVLEGKRILLCEDHPLNARIVVKLLENKGVIPECVSDGKEGLDRVIASEEGYYDAILMDIRMPVMDGLTATKKIRGLAREDTKTIPIIALTANAYDEDVESCREAGANEHLAKPVDSDVFYQTLAKYLQ